MVSANGMKWAVAILALSAGACAVGTGLPMWVEINYSDASAPLYLRYGLWQACVSVNSASLQCSEYTPTSSSQTLIARYLGTGGAGAILLSVIILVLYNCNCAQTKCLATTALLLAMGGVGAAGAAVGLFLINNLFGSMKIGIGSIIEMVGLGLGFIGILVLLGSILQKDEVLDRIKTPPPNYLRNERRVGPLPQPQFDPNERHDPGTVMPARDEAQFYLDRYKHYQDAYNDSSRAAAQQTLQSDDARLKRYEQYYREMGGRR